MKYFFLSKWRYRKKNNEWKSVRTEFHITVKDLLFTKLISITQLGNFHICRFVPLSDMDVVMTSRFSFVI